MLEKPRVLVSKCRYDGAVLPSKFVEALKPYVDFVQVCPEVEIGLGVPRDFVRLVLVDDKLELYQPKNDWFVTDEMNEYSHRVLSEINDVEGAILKGRSPTCGIKDVKIYHGTKKAQDLARVSEFLPTMFTLIFQLPPLKKKEGLLILELESIFWLSYLQICVLKILKT